ncbi:uncharacterized protein C8Q71DRAFT_196551 [Rhodofomes roseus]|uniref:WYL domain-containing protein n=1 Tax=Rhodofomes roseus TaxID=34475 RepID=A0ABQ8K7X3_9APHY|nr:uncharacterized protein C8Q71DRAFT_196551 [Rhodofomes roseus]KAH9833288.1 hypothetical protein C8Q71DRAFT_196551 [Rhodofomes roseus]
MCPRRPRPIRVGSYYYYMRVDIASRNEGAIAALSQILGSRWSNCEPLLEELEEVKRLVMQMRLAPWPDELTLQITEQRLLSVILDASASQSLCTRLSRLLHGWSGTGIGQRSDPQRLPAKRMKSIAGKLQETITGLRAAQTYAPLDDDDVLQAQHILHACLGLPLPLVWAILDEAEYWVCSIGHSRRVILSVGADSGAIQETHCCTAKLPPFVKKHRPLRRVVFKIEACSRGLQTSDNDNSWFEAGSDNAARRIIMHTPAAVTDFQTHRIQWDCSLSEGGTGLDTELQEWMGRFVGGEDLSVFARAQFPEWSIYVRMVQLELYCACV